MNTSKPESSPSHWAVSQVSESPISLLVSEWNIEAPSSDEPLPDRDMMEIRGWALASPHNQHSLHVVVQLDSKTLSFPMNVERPDVIQTILSQDAKDHPQLKCGFRYAFAVSEASRGFVLGFETGLEIHPAVKFEAR